MNLSQKSWRATLIPIKLDRGGGLPWLFADYRKEINTAVTRQRTVISKQRVSLGKRTFKQPAKVKNCLPQLKKCLTLMPALGL